MAEEQLQQFLEKVAQLNQLVALIEGNPQLRERLSACSNHLEVVALAADQGLQIGQRWGEPILQTNAAVNNLWASAAPPPGGERVQLLLEGKGLRLELIHSVAASTPSGQWYNQPMGEWVALLTGSAQLRFADEPTARNLGAGDWFWIAPNRCHRVEACSGSGGCLWLTLFIEPKLMAIEQFNP